MARLMLDINPNSSCGYHRLALPFKYLRVQPKRPTVIFNRLAHGGLGRLQGLRKVGYRIVMDLDDFWVLPESHYLHRAQGEQMARDMPAHIKAADMVWTTTAALADLVAPLNANVHVVPNALPFDQDQFTLDTSDERKGYVYAAGPSHYEDLKPAAQALNTRDLFLAGYQASNEEWMRIADLVPRACLMHKRPVDAYMDVYNGRTFALAPLVLNTFNACKSNLKVLEAGAKGLPIVASPVPPYFNELDRHRVSYAEHAHDWAWWASALSKDASCARQMGQELAAHVREHYTLTKVNELRRQLLED